MALKIKGFTFDFETCQMREIGKGPMWTFEEAMEAVTALQEETREFGYHLALGGGVLNNGQSDKDLDLYFLSLDDEGPIDKRGMLARLEEYFGPSEELSDPAYGGSTHYTYKVKFEFDNRRIDAFIV